MHCRKCVQYISEIAVGHILAKYEFYRDIFVNYYTSFFFYFYYYFLVNNKSSSIKHNTYINGSSIGQSLKLGSENTPSMKELRE